MALPLLQQSATLSKSAIYPFILRPRFLQFLEIWFEISGSRNLVREKWFCKLRFFFWVSKKKIWVCQTTFLEKWLQIKWLGGARAWWWLVSILMVWDIARSFHRSQGPLRENEWKLINESIYSPLHLLTKKISADYRMWF